jgi:NAD(P)-dependent dehydrogenase (short-subunit alcohol dehydrogenase family)
MCYLPNGRAKATAADNIRVNCVCPGAIDTPMLRWAASLDEHPERVVQACHKLSMFGRMGRPEEIARVIAFTSRRASVPICPDNAVVNAWRHAARFYALPTLRPLERATDGNRP